MSESLVIANISRSHKVLETIGNYAGPLALLAFGVALWYLQANENLFSFAAWSTLDLLTGFALLKTGKAEDRKAARLPLGYGIICAFVVAMIYKNGQWQWTFVETTCLVGTAIALLGWYLSKQALFAVIAFNVALLIASIPILISTYENPQTWEWWLWVGSATSATIGLYLNRPWTLGNVGAWLFVAVSEIVTVAMLVLLFRPYF